MSNGNPVLVCVMLSEQQRNKISAIIGDQARLQHVSDYGCSINLKTNDIVIGVIINIDDISEATQIHTQIISQCKRLEILTFGISQHYRCVPEQLPCKVNVIVNADASLIEWQGIVNFLGNVYRREMVLQSEINTSTKTAFTALSTMLELNTR